jgi:cation:H+ antiporter
MGGPLALATVAYGVTGWMMLARRRRAQANAKALVLAGGSGGDTVPAPTPGDDAGDLAKLARDQRWFLTIFVVKVALGLVTFAFKPWLGLLFFAAYAVYFWREMRGGGEHGDAEDLEPLLLQRNRSTPATWAVVTQTLVTLAIIFAASQLFVHQLDAVGPMLGLPAAKRSAIATAHAASRPASRSMTVRRSWRISAALSAVDGVLRRARPADPPGIRSTETGTAPAFRPGAGPRWASALAAPR